MEKQTQEPSQLDLSQVLSELAPAPADFRREHVDESLTWQNDQLEILEKGWDKSPSGYQWPASRLSRHDMAKLKIVSKLTKKPLTALLQEACSDYANQCLAELGLVTGNQRQKQGN